MCSRSDSWMIGIMFHSSLVLVNTRIVDLMSSFHSISYPTIIQHLEK